MLITPDINKKNRNIAVFVASAIAVIVLMTTLLWLPMLLLLSFCPIVYWLIRRRCVNRQRVMEKPFPENWEQTLESKVLYFNALSSDEKERFRQIIKVFLDEVRVTGIGTEIDDEIRVLVAASAAIPIFGFHDWEYRRLGEVLIYPDSFGEDYQATNKEDSNILGLTGLHELRGLIVLSKPSLIEGFETSSIGDNVGIHEFAHLVEVEDNESGLPPEVPWAAVKHWVEYVGKELVHPKNASDVRRYAYTNEHEFFAVLAEYFFKSPNILKKKDPELYNLMRDLYHQDTAALLGIKKSKRFRFQSNALCPCGSGKKYKNCCLSKSVKRQSANLK